MATIQEIQNTLTAGARAQAPATVDGQERFLKLLVAQMQNQDPLNPMDNAEVTTQLAQLNTVNGIERLNRTLEAMAASSSAQQSLQAAMMVGREVLVEGDRLGFTGEPVHFGLDLPQAVDRLTITITDASGQVVDSFETAAQPRGVLPLGWDGLGDTGEPLPVGYYTVSATARSGNNEVKVTPLVGARVESVGNGAGGIELQLTDQGMFTLDQIRRFL